jgi:hypothetical protein
MFGNIIVIITQDFLKIINYMEHQNFFAELGLNPE